MVGGDYIIVLCKAAAGSDKNFKTTYTVANIGSYNKTLDKKAIIHYNDTANGEVPKWLKGLPC